MLTALSGARSVNSLADVAQYYYVTDLRKDADWPSTISTNDVPSVGSGAEDDRVRWQHMTTFTIALGVSGTLNYRPDYKSGSVVTGDFAGIRNGAQNWPLWPDPLLETSLPDNYGNKKSLWDNPKSIDDFWHTAVNGRGTYFSAANPTSVIAGLADALAGIQARLGSGSAAATSNLEPVSGDNLIYLASYTTQKWTGDVQAKEIDLATGAINPTVIWSAQAQLDTRTRNACDDRNIYLFRQGATNNLTNFTWNTSTCDASGNPAALLPDGLNATEQAHFGTLNVSLLSQYPAMTDGTVPIVDQRTPAVGANLVNFLRGQRGLEGFITNDVTKLYRAREHVLGDIVNGQPTYVRAPFSLYGDAGLRGVQVGQRGPDPDALRPGQRRHAACLLRRHQHRRSARRQGSLGVDPEHGAAEALPARRQQLQGQPRLLRRRHAVGQRHVRYRLGQLEDDPRGRPEQRRQGLLRARRHRSARAQGPVGVQVELDRLPLVGGQHRRSARRWATPRIATSARPTAGR